MNSYNVITLRSEIHNTSSITNNSKHRYKFHILFITQLHILNLLYINNWLPALCQQKWVITNTQPFTESEIQQILS